MYWWLLRLFSLFLLPSIFYDWEIFILIQSLFCFHFCLGLQSIVFDYTHDKKSKILLLIFIRLLNFEFIRFIIELLL